MRWSAIALVDGDPKRMRCKISNFGADENVGLLSRKEDRPHQNFLTAPKISYAFLTGRYRNCFQFPVLAVAHKLGPQSRCVLVCIPFLNSTVNDHTELAFAVVKRNDQIHRPREPYLGCCRFSFWSVEKHIAPRLRHVLAMSAPGRHEGANTRTTRNRHLRVLIQFATKWSLTLQVLSYVGG